MVASLEKSKSPVSNLSAETAQPKISKAERRGDQFTASWYVAMHSKKLGNKPKAIKLFGKELVAWRDKAGLPIIMEQYCSHMGMSLAQGEVIDGCIHCPFHNWTYDNTGQCVAIPNVEHIPPKAHQHSYITQERYGYIWAWYGTKEPLFPLPEVPAAENKQDYMLFRFYDKTKATVRQIIENTFDYAHFDVVHKIKIDEGGSSNYTLYAEEHPPITDDPPIQEGARFGAAFEATNLEVDLISRMLGFTPNSIILLVDGWTSAQRITVFLDGEIAYKVLLAASPITPTSINQEILVMIKKTGKFWLDPFYYILFCMHNRFGTFQDLPLYDYSSLDAGGVHVKHDYGVLRFRDFYQQWVNKCEAAYSQIS